MSKENFTQGEWLLKDGYQVGIKVSFGDGFFTLASCQVFNEGKANAHLISAAPDLYNELKKIHKLITEYASTGFTDEDLAMAIFESQSGRFKALAKAIGEKNA